MPNPILQTKLYIPSVRTNLVPRTRLIQKLNAGLGGEATEFPRKLTLISAPAGFGKTTLVSAWLAGFSQVTGCEQPAAWLSLDEGDCGSTRFLAYLIAVSPKMGEGMWGLLHSPQPPPKGSCQAIPINYWPRLKLELSKLRHLLTLSPIPELSNRGTFSSSLPLIELLSARELDVLRLFKTELSGPEVANKLVVALSTIRTHTKNIYSKLNVNNRRAAVKRAEELDLI